MSMQVQACKDKASTSAVKVVTLKTVREEHDRFRCLIHRDELDRLTLDFDSRRKQQISMLQSQRQGQQCSINWSWQAYYCMHECYIIIASMHAIYSAG